MKDRFKFRVWDKEYKNMFYPEEEYDYIEIDANGGLCGYVSDGLWVGGLNCILIQCTGLKDKKGTLIYEGDIVRLIADTFTTTYVVKFGDFAMFSLDFQSKYEKGSTAVYGWYLDGMKYPIPLSISLDTSGLKLDVIGNKYENPELLSVRNEE